MKEEITQMLRELATQLGTTTEFLWGVLIRQAFISGTYNAILAVVCIVTICVGSVKVKETFLTEIKQSLPYAQREKLEAWQIFTIITLSIASVISLVVLAAISGNMMTALFNPEYWALNKVMGMLK